MELDHGWSDLDDDFIFRVVQILSSDTPLINVCRPATAILKKLVEADPMSAPGPTIPSSSKGGPQSQPGSVYKFGFECVFEQMRKEKSKMVAMTFSQVMLRVCLIPWSTQGCGFGCVH